MNLSTESIIRSSKSSITNFISQSGHRFGKTLKIWISVFFLPYYIHSPPYYLILSVQQFLIIYLSFYVSMYLSIYQPIHLSHSLSLPLLIFFQSLYLFACLPLFSSIYVSFSLSSPSFPNSLSSSLCLYLFPFVALMLSLFCFSGDAMDWIARPMS